MPPRRAMRLLLAVVILCCSAGGALGDCLAGMSGVVFGDSLSGIDNIMNFNPGRYSNGKLWPEYLDWNLAADVALPGATATAIYANTNISNSRRMLFGQLQYYQSLGYPNISTSCIVIFIGLNDLSYNDVQLVSNPSDVPVVFRNIISNITATVYMLAAQGARCFYVFSLPNPTLFPGVADNAALPAAEVGMLMLAYTAALQSALVSVPVPSGTQLYTVDANAAFVAAINGPAPNGSAWSSTTVPCQANPAYYTPYNCGLCFWFNYYHPTTLAHQQLAAQFSQRMCAASTSNFCNTVGGACQITFSTIAVQIEDLVGASSNVVFTAATTFTTAQVITTMSLVSSFTLAFTQGLTFTNQNQGLSCSGLTLGASSVITAATVTVTTLVVSATATFNAVVSITSGSVTLGAGSSSGTLAFASSALVSGSRFTGTGQLQCRGRGQRVVLRFVLIVVTISVVLTSSSSVSQTRRTDLSTVTPLQQCGTVNLGTLALASGTAAIVDLSCVATQSGYTAYSNYIGTLSSTGGLLYLTGISSSTKPTVIASWSNVAATPIEIDNVTTTGAYCVNVLIYGSSGSCTTSWNSVTWDSCQSGYTCSLTGSSYSSTQCAVTFCQSQSGNPGLFGLIALIAILPVGALCAFFIWRYLRTPAEAEVPPVHDAYFYPQPYPGATAFAQPAYPQLAYPQAVYPQAVYPQGVYAMPGAEVLYHPELATPMPTPLALGF